MTETYSLASDFGGNIYPTKLIEEIADDVTITTALSHINVGVSTADNVDIVFVSTISGPEKIALDAVVAAHDSVSYSGASFVAHDSTGGTDITAGFTAIAWDIEDKKDNIYTHAASSSEIAFNVTGDYSIRCEISIDMSSGNNRSNSVVRIMKDTGSGFIEISGTRAYSYHSDSTQGIGTISISTDLIGINRKDKIRIETMRLSGSSTLVTVANGSRIQIKTN